MKLHVDFETRDEVDLKKQGLAVYVESPHLDILCMAHAIGEEEVQLWIPGMPFPIDLAIHLSEGGEFHAHNAAFEFAVWNSVGVKKYGFPPLKIEQVHCNMVNAYAMGLPGSLEKLAIALNLDAKKDMAGNRAMMQLSKPREIKEDGTIVWWEKKDVPAKYEALYAYCKQDVNVERSAGKLIKPISKQERQVWLLDQKINARGIQIDIESVRLAEKMILDEKDRLDKEINTITDGAVEACSSATQIGNYLRSQGVEVDSVAKDQVLALLKTDLPGVCRRVLELRQEAAKSSTAKLTAMLLRASRDGRARNTLQFNGAGTGRWAGRGIMFHNLPRPKIKQKEIESLLSNLNKGAEYIDMFHGAITTVISDCLRGFIIADEGKTLHSNDWSNIEGRTLAWLANETWKVKAFEDFDNGIGADIYKLSYSASFHIALEKVEDQHRQIGKVLELSMGYQGGVVAFHSMAKNYGVVVTDERANELKNGWRSSHPRIVSYWNQLGEAALNAVRHPGSVFSAGPKDHREIKYKVEGSFLVCRLPSGRCLYYPFPQIKQKETPWGEMRDSLTYMTEDSLTKKWVRGHFYGGLAAENITQSVARDILAEALLRVENSGYNVVLHVHDEIVSENDLTDKTKNQKTMSELMCVLPDWAKGLPIAASGWSGKRYRK
jgi:DNA polymerase bacteriophage-type